MCFADHAAFGCSVDHSGNDIQGAGAVCFDTEIEDGPSPNDEEHIDVGRFAPLRLRCHGDRLGPHQVPLSLGSTRRHTRLSPVQMDRAQSCWLPGLVSQSVVLWDVVAVEFHVSDKGHTEIHLGT